MTLTHTVLSFGNQIFFADVSVINHMAVTRSTKGLDIQLIILQTISNLQRSSPQGQLPFGSWHHQVMFREHRGSLRCAWGMDTASNNTHIVVLKVKGLDSKSH